MCFFQSRLLEQNKGKSTQLCVAVRLERKQTAMHFQSAKHRQFLKIVLATPTLVTKARGQTPPADHKKSICFRRPSCYTVNFILHALLPKSCRHVATCTVLYTMQLLPDTGGANVYQCVQASLSKAST